MAGLKTSGLKGLSWSLIALTVSGLWQKRYHAEAGAEPRHAEVSPLRFDTTRDGGGGGPNPEALAAMQSMVPCLTHGGLPLFMVVPYLGGSRMHGLIHLQ